MRTLKHWNYSGLPPVERYNAVVDTANELLSALRLVVSSGAPCQREHPSMWDAWQCAIRAINKAEGASRYCTCEANGIEIPSRHAEDCRYRTMPRYIQENKYGRAEDAKAEGK